MRLVYKIKIPNRRNTLENINKILLKIYLFNTIFLPADTFNLKIMSLVSLLVINADCYLKPKSKIERTILLLGFGLTSVNIIMSFLFTGELYANISIGYPGYILLLFPIILKYRIDFWKMTQKLLLAMAYFIVLMAILDVIGIIPLYSNSVLMWLSYTENALIGKGSHLIIGICLFLKTTPMLLLLIPQIINSRRYISLTVVMSALILSGTRGNIFTAIAVFVYCFIFYKKSNKRITLLVCIVVIAGMFILLEGSIIEAITEMFLLKSSSDDVRSNDLNSIINLWKNNPISFITGTGFSSKFFSLGHNTMTNIIELSYWNLLRQIGLGSFILTMYMYLKPIKGLLKNSRTIIVAYVGYLVVAYTNPLLYSSTGMTILLVLYILEYKENETNRNTVYI